MSIVTNNLGFIYNKGSAFSKEALKDININISQGEKVAIVGHTGSGKTTFVQHLNALIRVQSGSLVVNGQELAGRKVDLKKLRGQVGMVFQYPEYQLFADTVEQDIAFGPRNLGASEQDIPKLVSDAMAMVGLDYDSYRLKSPFDLSGGQKRRVALAGVLAMQPQILVLDEPTAGLDPLGKGEILHLVDSLNRNNGITIVMVSHDMNEVYEHMDRVIVFESGSVKYDCDVFTLFSQHRDIAQLGLTIPTVAQFTNHLGDNGIDLGKVRTVGEATLALSRQIGGAK